jgi:hypothetical protein
MKDFTAVKLEVYAPEEFVSIIQETLHKVGAGKLGHYDRVLSQIPAKGYWRPLEGSQPHSGWIGSVCSAPEVKIEVHCRRDIVKEVIKAVKKVHPYEIPLINVIPLANHLFDYDI